MGAGAELYSDPCAAGGLGQAAAMLVRGADRFGHFEREPPKAELDPEGMAPVHDKAVASTGTLEEEARHASSRSEGRAAAANMDVSARLVARYSVQGAS